DYCFNLHDQRTIFNVGDTPRPATVSFLAPAHDEERSISVTRGLSMQLIAAMNSQLQKMIPGQVGRYDDAFNHNCVGDTFQMLETPTLLFEAGHFKNDYQRESTREYIFHALAKALDTISGNKIKEHSRGDYFEIPENGKRFVDILIHNADIINPKLPEGSSIGVMYKETLYNGSVEFIPTIDKTGNLQPYFGHITYDCNNPGQLQVLKQQVFWSSLSRHFK
ncbi:MAG: peptidase M14, partial [Pricia sp.]|nr:peptidase M14 [Pricia sp.]